MGFAGSGLSFSIDALKVSAKPMLIQTSQCEKKPDGITNDADHPISAATRQAANAYAMSDSGPISHTSRAANRWAIRLA